MSERPPWIDERGATDVDGFLAAYAADSNTFWRADTGHIQNVVDELIERAGSRCSSPDPVREVAS